MTEEMLHVLEKASHGISLVGVVVIVGGFLMAAGQYAVRFRRRGLKRGLSGDCSARFDRC